MSDVDYDEIELERANHAAETAAEHEVAMRQTVDALIAEGLPVAVAPHVRWSDVCRLARATVHAGSMDGVRQWAQRLGTPFALEAWISDDGEVVLSPQARADLPAGRLTVIGLSKAVATGITGATLRVTS